MNLLLNDLSLHGQFADVTSFRDSIKTLMLLRKTASEFGREVYANKEVLNKPISASISLYQALQRLPESEKRSVAQWLTRWGPFWEDFARHSPDDWVWCNGDIVTDTAVGETAYCSAMGIDRRLVSLAPSEWTREHIDVGLGELAEREVQVLNYWLAENLLEALRAAEPSIESWSSLEATSRAKFPGLTFTQECFNPLRGQPFVPGAALRILDRLVVLDKLMSSTDASGRRNEAGHRIIENHFKGDRAWFSDSSDTEKSEFRTELRFPHPDRVGDYLDCTWHGKVNHPPFRIHFAWPERPGSPLYVVYVGLKITRR